MTASSEHDPTIPAGWPEASAHVLVEDDLTVRPVRRQDAPAVLAAVRSSLQHLRPWMHWAEGEIAPRDVEGFIDRVESGAERSFAICDRRGTRFCGTCAINRIDEHHRTAKLGYWLRADATGQGLATRAARMVLIHGLQHMRLQRIEIVVSTANTPSQKVAERLGLAEEGTRRSALQIGDQRHDARVFVALQRDLPRLRTER